MHATPAHPCVVLGVTGSIAACKAAELASALVKNGCVVHVIMTESATKLVQPQTFFTLSRNPVTTDLWATPEWEPGHIALADHAHLLVIAPCTANVLGKLANGIADDALTTYALTHTGPVILAPAMNPRMWAHPAVQENCRRLRERGVTILEPGHGPVACGDVGVGRMPEPTQILGAIRARLAVTATPGTRKKVLITAGPTREPLDPVRFLTNRSSGKMGYALAAAAAALGHQVVLISGPVALMPPAGCRLVRVETAAEMAAAVLAEFADSALLVMSAAVADFRPVTVAVQKLKKLGGTPELILEPTEDVLARVAPRKTAGQKVMGFAAETERLAENAQEKLARKKLDWIVANDVSRTDIGFDSDENEVTVFRANGEAVVLPRLPKAELAVKLLEMALA